MNYKKQYLKISLILFLVSFSSLSSTQVQLITAHKKSNGVLLRIVTNSIVDIENIAGWKGQENWFYLTFNKTSLNQVGNISVPEARLITISIWDANNVSIVEKAIRESNLGLNPMTEGNLIRVPIPALSEERRKELLKVAAQIAENSKIAIRNIRRDIIEDIRKSHKNNEISNDEKHQNENVVQKVTDDFINNIDKIFQKKQSEILDTN